MTAKICVIAAGLSVTDRVDGVPLLDEPVGEQARSSRRRPRSGVAAAGRFDRQVTLGYPDRAGREAILRIHTRGLPLAPDVELAAIARATPGSTGPTSRTWRTRPSACGV